MISCLIQQGSIEDLGLTSAETAIYNILYQIEK